MSSYSINYNRYRKVMNYVKSNIVMLSTEKATKIILNKSTNNLIFRDKDVIPHNNVHEGQELYFTTDEEINVGDWFIDLRDISNLYNEDLYKVLSKEDAIFANKIGKKIVSSTDKSLEVVSKGINPVYEKLPRPSNEFLKAYCESYSSNNPITEVNIEYEVLPNWGDEEIFAIKIAPDNTISISKIEEKTYTKDEVTILLKRAFGTAKSTGCYLTGDQVNRWINQNI